MYTISEIAKIVLSISPVTHKKLQKLCYYIYAWYYVVFNEKICDVEFEAWVHGPVSPELYYEYKSYGWNTIQITTNGKIVSDKHAFISKILDIYGYYGAEELEAMTHKELPWLNARRGLPKWAFSNTPITDEDIKKFYASEFPETFNQIKQQFSSI